MTKSTAGKIFLTFTTPNVEGAFLFNQRSLSSGGGHRVSITGPNTQKNSVKLSSFGLQCIYEPRRGRHCASRGKLQ